MIIEDIGDFCYGIHEANFFRSLLKERRKINSNKVTIITTTKDTGNWLNNVFPNNTVCDEIAGLLTNYAIVFPMDGENYLITTSNAFDRN